METEVEQIIELSAIITRVDGTIEYLGVIASNQSEQSEGDK